MQENKNPSLYTKRLVLREFREEDWLAVHEYGSDHDAVKYMIWGPNSEADTKSFIQRELNHQKEQPRSDYNFALICRRNDRLIGACAVMIRNAERKEGEIGYILNRNYWKQGYMSEAAGRVVSFGFEDLGLHRIYATCDPANTGSYRIMEKIGMQREGYLRRNLFIHGVWRDSLLYSILEDEWRRGKERLPVLRASPGEINIEYIENGRDELDLIKPLWQKLIEHHRTLSSYHKDHYRDVTFEQRKKQLLEKTSDSRLRVDLARDLRSGEIVGYCVTSLIPNAQGEIESIFVEKDYRSFGIGDSLMDRALGWLDSLAARRKIVVVGEGNEGVFGFYRHHQFYPRMTLLEQKG